MKSTFKNEAKLWWHCLIHFHRQFTVTFMGRNKMISCYDCDYGKDSK